MRHGVPSGRIQLTVRSTGSISIRQPPSCTRWWCCSHTGKRLSISVTSGKNFMPRVAALLDVMQISEIIKVESPDRSFSPSTSGAT